MKRKMIIYHGSEQIIKQPEYGKGNPNNDYGLGFYCKSISSSPGFPNRKPA